MTLRSERQGPRFIVQALATDGSLLGHIVNRMAADEAEIEWIEVEAAHRGRGIGRSLLQEAMRVATCSGARTMYLEVRESNQAAQGLYCAMGFEVYGRREAYYSAPAEAAVLWRKVLAGGVSR